MEESDTADFHIASSSTSEDFFAQGPDSNTHKNPFDNLENEIDDEQLRTWHQMNEQVQGLVQSYGGEDNYGDVMIDDSLLITSADTMEVDIPDDDEELEPGPSTTDTSKSTPIAALANLPASMEITLQYLSGKMTFADFMEQLERKNSTADQPGESKDETGAQPGVDTESAEVQGTSKTQEKKKPKVKRRRKCDLPKLLQSSMGEVSMTFALGNHEKAIQQCMEIIRQAPDATKPFQTLAMIYEDLGDMQKSLQYGLIAAYLDPSDSEEWAKMAELCVEQNDINQAIKCYTQGIAAGKENKMDLIWERSKLYERTKEFKRSLEGYQALLNLLPAEDSESYFKLAWAITRSYYELGEKTSALETITKAFKDHPGQITSEDVNLLLELQIPEKKFQESLDVFVMHCGVSFTFPGDKIWSAVGRISPTTIKDKFPTSVRVPDMLPVDLRSKLAVCMIHLKHTKLVKIVIEPLYDGDIEVNGDLYLDIAEAYMDNNYYKYAEPLLKKLVTTHNYHLAAVWLRYGECLKYQGDIAGAVKAYAWVVKLAPSHIGAKMSLSALQQQLGKHDEALEALAHNEFEDTKLNKEEQQMLLQKCHLLHAQGKIDEFLANAKQLLFQEWRDVEAENMSYLQAIRTYKHRKESLLNHFESKGKDIIKLGTQMKLDRKYTHVIAFDDLWDMFKRLCQALIDEKRYREFEEVSLLGMLCPLFSQNERKILDFEFFILTAGLLYKNPVRAYAFGRHFVMENIDSVQVWNMFMQVIMMCNDTRHNRFCLRKMLHEPNNIPLGIMNGHNSMASGSYKHSLGEYANVFRKTPTDPLLSLCIGLDFIHCASQRFAAKRHYLVTQGLAFLNNYMQLRGECQETYYNLGRALHQINILYAAVHYYKKALDTPPCVGQKQGMFDVTMEAAYNLSLIYRHSGSPDYARYLLYKYCVL